MQPLGISQAARRSRSRYAARNSPSIARVSLALCGRGLPAAIAAKLAAPERASVCILGDGCFQMTCGELAVARRIGGALPIVVLNDGWLSLIQVKQARRNLPIYGTDLVSAENEAPPAHYFGVPVVAVRDAPSLRRAVTRALAANHPVVIEARIDGAQYMTTVYD
jgi:acetolactate synthase-1/2/3 large subunit